MLEYHPIDKVPRAFDHEMTQLELGLRGVVKREFCSEAERTRALDAGWSIALVQGGYDIETHSADIHHGKGAHHTVFIGSEGAVKDAKALEAIERRGHGDTRLDAIRALGALLGYPSCCTEAYLSQHAQDESASFNRLFIQGPHIDALAGNNLFVLSHVLISHFPCTMTCLRSAALARAGWTELAQKRPADAEALQSLLQSPITVWDRYRFIIEHPISGPCAPHRIEGDRRLLDHPPLSRFLEQLKDGYPPGGVRFEFKTMW